MPQERSSRAAVRRALVGPSSESRAPSTGMASFGPVEIVMPASPSRLVLLHRRVRIAASHSPIKHLAIGKTQPTPSRTTVFHYPLL